MPSGKTVFSKLIAFVASLLFILQASPSHAAGDLPELPTWGTATIQGESPYTGNLSVGFSIWGDRGTGWPDGTEFHAQWLRDGVPIEGENLYVYYPSVADEGHHIGFQITGSLIGYRDKVLVTETQQIVPPRVTISGQMLVGKTLTATAPTFPGITYKFFWYRNYGTEVIKGATKSTYKIPDSMVGYDITVLAQAFQNGSLVSSGFLGPFDNIVRVSGGKHIEAKFSVSIRGSVMVDRVLYGSATNPAGRGVCEENWLRDGRTVIQVPSGQVGYLVAAADVGHRITYKLKCFYPGRSGSTTKTASSATIVKSPLFAGKPSIDGSVTAGSTVSAVVQEVYGQAWTTGTTFKYQWLKDGKSISGATSSTYSIPQAFGGHKLSLRVTGGKPGYISEAATSRKYSVGFAD